MRKDASSLAGSERIHELKFERRSRNRGCIAAFAPAPAVSARFQHNQHPMIPATQIWNFSTLLSAFSRPSSSPSVPASASGEPLTCWKATETTTPVQMLMYGREAQSKTRIASPATIPKSGERNRKIHSCMLYLISIWTYQADTAISLLAVNARLPIVRTKQE